MIKLTHPYQCQSFHLKDERESIMIYKLFGNLKYFSTPGWPMQNKPSRKLGENRSVGGRKSI